MNDWCFRPREKFRTFTVRTKLSKCNKWNLHNRIAYCFRSYVNNLIFALTKVIKYFQAEILLYLRCLVNILKLDTDYSEKLRLCHNCPKNTTPSHPRLSCDSFPSNTRLMPPYLHLRKSYLRLTTRFTHMNQHEIFPLLYHGQPKERGE